MIFFDNDQLDKINRMSNEEKKQFGKMFSSAFVGMLRGIDNDLYINTTKEMSKLLEDFRDLLSRNDFTNDDLQILYNYFNQGIKIINELKERK